MQRATEAADSRFEVRAGVMDLAELQGHLVRARQQRARFITGLLRRGLGAVVRLLRRGVPAAPRRRRGRVPCALPPDRHHAHPSEESRHAPVRTKLHNSRADGERRAPVRSCGSDAIEEMAP